MPRNPDGVALAVPMAVVKLQGDSPRSLTPTSSARLIMSGPLNTSGPVSGPLVSKSGPVSMAVCSDSEAQKRYDEELRAAERISFSVDLAFAAKRQLVFLRTIDSLPCLLKGPAVLRAIRRYQKFWMPLVADSLKFDALLNVDSKGKSLLPPLDVQWVWHCHRLHPVGYRQYCITKFGRVIDSPLFPDVASESFAQERCRRLWSIVYQKEPYDIMSSFYKYSNNSNNPSAQAQVVPVDVDIDGLEELLSAVARQASFNYYYVSQPYMWEDTFLQASVERYKCFLHVMAKSKGKSLGTASGIASGMASCVPTFDIDLIWHSHQLSPAAYAKDTKALLGSVADSGSSKAGQDGFENFERTASLWESTFGSSYEKAGSMYRNTRPVNVPPPPAVSEMKNSLVLEKPPSLLPWDHKVMDQNPTKYPVLTPRHVLQVCILIKCGTSMMTTLRENANLFVRMRTLDAASTCLKLESSVVPFMQEAQWQKLWVMQCEMKTKGVMLELRHHVDGCMKSFQKTKRAGSATRLSWAELAKAPSLSREIVFPVREKRFRSLERGAHPLQLKLDVSVTPPVQASYLLKSVPDRVTDDQGAMLSSSVVRRRRNHEAQSGRWISRTVLSHNTKESFIIRIRAAKGAWRKSGERPVGVDWNERVINIHEGGWNYLASHVGVAPEKIVASASPLAHELQEYKLSWALSTGDTLIISRQMSDRDLKHHISWERHLEFTLKTAGRGGAGLARLVNGRKQQYEVAGASAQEEEGFVTLVRYGSYAPQGKATALFNWKMSAMEVTPEEDVVLVLLLCTATMRSIADFGGLTAGNEYTRRRMKESRPGAVDWGSVVLENSSARDDSSLALWYWNCNAVGGDDDGPADSTHPGRSAGSDNNKAVDWNATTTDQGTISTSSQRSPTLPPPPTPTQPLPTEATPARPLAISTPTRGNSGRRTAANLQENLQVNPKIPLKRPLTIS